MKTITLSAFKNLLARKGWNHKHECKVIEKLDCQIDGGNEDFIDITCTYVEASMISKLDNIEIKYIEIFSYNEDGKGSVSFNNCYCEIDGVNVVCEDSDFMIFDSCELIDYLETEFKSIDFNDVNDILLNN